MYNWLQGFGTSASRLGQEATTPWFLVGQTLREDRRSVGPLVPDTAVWGPNPVCTRMAIRGLPHDREHLLARLTPDSCSFKKPAPKRAVDTMRMFHFPNSP